MIVAVAFILTGILSLGGTVLFTELGQRAEWNDDKAAFYGSAALLFIAGGFLVLYGTWVCPVIETVAR